MDPDLNPRAPHSGGREAFRQPSQRLLVDGMNVIGSRPDGWWRDRRAAVEALIDRLAEDVRGRAIPTTVVFDGRPFPLRTDLPEQLEVRFASRPGPNAADADIVELVASSPNPAAITVVTSDAALAKQVARLGARTQGAGAFRRQLEDRARPGRS